MCIGTFWTMETQHFFSCFSAEWKKKLLTLFLCLHVWLMKGTSRKQWNVAPLWYPLILLLICISWSMRGPQPTPAKPLNICYLPQLPPCPPILFIRVSNSPTPANPSILFYRQQLFLVLPYYSSMYLILQLLLNLLSFAIADSSSMSSNIIHPCISCSLLHLILSSSVSPYFTSLWMNMPECSNSNVSVRTCT